MISVNVSFSPFYFRAAVGAYCYQCRLYLHWALGTPSQMGPLARKYLPGFPYS